MTSPSKTRSAAKASERPAETTAVSRRPVENIVPEVMGGISTPFDEDTLRAIATFEDALAVLESVGEKAVDVSSVLGDGFTLLKNKGILEGVPILFLSWAFHQGDFGSPFVAAHIVSRNPDGNASRYIIVDGSTGICDQLATYTHKTGKRGGLVARSGLRKSEYDYTDPTDGSVKPASTFYIDTSV